MRKKYPISFYLKQAYFPAFKWGLVVMTAILVMKYGSAFVFKQMGMEVNGSLSFSSMIEFIIRGTFAGVFILGNMAAFCYYFNIIDADYDWIDN